MSATTPSAALLSTDKIQARHRERQAVAWPGEGPRDFSLTALAYNLQRVLNIVGFTKMMAVVRA